MKDVKKRNKIWFIVLVTIFGLLWVASLTFFGIASLNEAATDSIQSWYASTFSSEAHPASLNLFTVSLVMTIVSTAALLITLLFKELRKKYGNKRIGQ